jgi:gluconate 2-dehydrogenase gamma chain
MPDAGGSTPPPPAAAGIPRRRLLQLGGAGAVGLVVGGAAGYAAGHAPAARTATSQPQAAPAPAASTATSAPPPLRFFNDAEAAVVTAMAERIFPADEQGPGATDAHVVHYIDGQLAGGWGWGQKMYRQGPYLQPADSGHGWQYPLVPRDVYRQCLQDLAAYCSSQFGKPFDQLAAADQDQVLTDMSKGKLATFTTVPSDVFFAMFRQNVLEGLFGDPLYGGNHNMVGWKWIGFPGDPMAYGDPYAKLIARYEPYRVDPKPLQ